MKSIAVFAAAAALCLSAWADYPDKPIRMVLPYAPGGGADTVGRPLALDLSKRLNTPIVVDNKGGAGGNIAMEFVAHAPPDGYTVVMSLAAQLSVNQALFKDIRYDALKDFEPVSLIGRAPYFLAVNPTFPARTLQEFIEVVRKNPGKYSYASSGPGSGLHLSMELLKSMAKIDLVHVPYKGGGGAYADTIAGTVQAMFIGAGTAKGYVDSGRLRVLAVSTPQRSPVMPDVPTFAESGLPGYESDVWYALLAPKGTPAAVVRKLHAETVAALKGPLGQRFASEAIQPIGSTPEELTAYIRSERTKWEDVIRRSGATSE